MIRRLVLLAATLAAWSLAWAASGRYDYILPPPWAVAAAFADNTALLAHHAGITLAEIVLGLVLGGGFGALAALGLALSRPAALWLWPLFVATQALPVFAIAPLLVLWLGYGVASKVAMAALIIFFPVASGFYDGLRRTDPELLDLAATMNAPRRAVLRHIRLPAALPGLASGLKVGAAVAPIGAVVGEWVGSGAGLGFLMLHANARMQVPLMFAALVLLAAAAVLLHAGVGLLLHRALPWAHDSLETSP
ncbi:ABC transporter permease [Oleispirillum naphthae]|uniref:ABC transporter permease n=1 Tax=Oleispirillum naphthae TaxID=2838853 RepID=UPI0030824D13